MLIDKDFQNVFLKRINSIILRGGCNYIDAILEASEEHQIEPEVAAKNLTKPIIEKLEKEGIEFNILSKKSSKLPI